MHTIAYENVKRSRRESVSFHWCFRVSLIPITIINVDCVYELCKIIKVRSLFSYELTLNNFI